jgi:hypothetical protein
MKFESEFTGMQGLTAEDCAYTGSTYSDVRKALEENAYYRTWGAPDEPPLPTFEVTLRRALGGLFQFGRNWMFQNAAQRIVKSQADMRWGRDRRGYRRILHPNGVCLFGTWQIDNAPDGVKYSGYFRKGSQALLIARYSTCCTETRRNRNRSLSLVGKLYPTTDSDHKTPMRTANFITQEDLGGSNTPYINDVELFNAPNTTPWRRGAALPVFLVTGAVFLKTDSDPSVRQLYPIAELGEPQGNPINTPRFMRIRVDENQPYVRGDDLDFRDEVLGHIYDQGNPEPKRTLTFTIEVTDQGTRSGLLAQRWKFSNWMKIGRIVFTAAVASYNGDFVLHFPHPLTREIRAEKKDSQDQGGP